MRRPRISETLVGEIAAQIRACLQLVKRKIVANTDFKSVDEYIAAQPEGSRAALQQVRGAIRKALPKAEEVISYQIAAYRVEGGIAIYFAGWKKHYSLYPLNARVLELLKETDAAHEVNERGTVRFPLNEPVPVRLIGRIAKLMAEAVAERKKASEAKKLSTKPKSKVTRLPASSKKTRSTR